MKHLPAILLLLCAVHSPAQATLYRYSGNMPMAKVMLDLMEVMGFIRRVPESSASVGGGHPLSAASLWGFNPGMMQIPVAGTNAFSSTGLNALPLSLLTGMSPGRVPAVGHNPQLSHSKRELEALIQARQQGVGSVPGATGRPASMGSHPATNLNGVWRDSNQNVLSIFGSRFVWTDKNGVPVHGQFSVRGDTMTTYIAEKNATMTYRIEYQGNQFMAETQTGLKYQFVRQE